VENKGPRLTTTKFLPNEKDTVREILGISDEAAQKIIDSEVYQTGKRWPKDLLTYANLSGEE